MVTVEQAKQDVSQAKSSVTQVEQQLSSAERLLSEQRKSLPQVLSKSKLREMGGLIGRQQRQQVVKAERQIGAQQAEVEKSKSEVSQYKSQISSTEQEIAKVETDIKGYEIAEKFLERGVPSSYVPDKYKKYYNQLFEQRKRARQLAEIDISYLEKKYPNMSFSYDRKTGRISSVKIPQLETSQLEKTSESISALKTPTTILDIMRDSNVAQKQSIRETVSKVIDGKKVEYVRSNVSDAYIYGTVKTPVGYVAAQGMGKQLNVRPSAQFVSVTESLVLPKTKYQVYNVVSQPIRQTQELEVVTAKGIVAVSGETMKGISKLEEKPIVRKLVSPLGVAAREMKKFEQTLPFAVLGTKLDSPKPSKKAKTRALLEFTVGGTQVARGAVTYAYKKPITTVGLFGLGAATSIGLGVIGAVTPAASAIVKTAGLGLFGSYAVTKGVEVSRLRDSEKAFLKVGEESLKLGVTLAGAKLGSKLLKYTTEEIEYREPTRPRKITEIKEKVIRMKDEKTGVIKEEMSIKVLGEKSPPIKVTTTTRFRESFGFNPLRTRTIPAKKFFSTLVPDVSYDKGIQFSSRGSRSSIIKLNLVEAKEVISQGNTIFTKGKVSELSRIKLFDKTGSKGEIEFYLKPKVKMVESRTVLVSEREIGEAARESYFTGISNLVGKKKFEPFILKLTEREFVIKDGVLTPENVFTLASGGGRPTPSTSSPPALSEGSLSSNIQFGGTFENMFSSQVPRQVQTVDIVAPLAIKFGSVPSLRSEQRNKIETTLAVAPSFRQEITSINITNERTDVATSQSSAQQQVQELVQIQVQVPKLQQVTVPNLLTETARPRRKPRETGFEFKLDDKKPLFPKQKTLTGSSIFEVFTKKGGVDVSIGKVSTESAAAIKLRKTLRTTARASGFVESGGKRIDVGEYFPSVEFRRSKTEPLRVVQKRSKRLTGRGEQREVILAKRRGGFFGKSKRSKLL